MKKCIKCKKEADNLYRFGTLCLECDNKRERGEFWTMVAFITVTLLIIVGIRLTWAKLVYGDMRCFLAECRIIK